jgi:hypothetical protein
VFTAAFDPSRFTQIKRSCSIAFAGSQPVKTKTNCSENFHRRLAMKERRRFPRTKCFKGAKIKSPGQTPITCIVRNVSAEGAKIELPYSVVLPSEFELCFDIGPQKRQCRVVWHTARDAGIWFARQA